MSIESFQFNRQKPIGNYIVDFYCRKAKLVIEVDGSQHYQHDGREKYKERHAYMSQLGLRVLRFSDRDILVNIDGVFEVISRYL